MKKKKKQNTFFEYNDPSDFGLRKTQDNYLGHKQYTAQLNRGPKLQYPQFWIDRKTDETSKGMHLNAQRISTASTLWRWTYLHFYLQVDLLKIWNATTTKNTQEVLLKTLQIFS